MTSVMATGHGRSRRGDPAALAVWELFWQGLERLVRDTRGVLADQLRDSGLELRAASAGADHRAGCVQVGRARLRIDCLLACPPPDAGEGVLVEAFGAATPLVRIRVVRESARGPRPVALFAADPSTRRWLSPEADLGPEPLDDGLALEKFFWTLLVDPPEVARPGRL
jgi:hypothetical protein